MLQQNLRDQGRRSGERNPAQRWMRWSWLAVVICGLYMLSAKLSLSLLTPDGVAVFWPAAGISAGALIAFGPQARWAVVAGTMAATVVANLLGDRNLSSALVFALCNAAEAVLAAGLIQYYFGSPFSLDRLRNVLGLLGAAIVATAVSGIGGALGFAFFHGAGASIFDTWQNWFASDALGIVTIAPLVIGLVAAAREPPSPDETVEGLLALASLIVMSVIVIALPPKPWTTVVPIALLFPVLLWIAARCRPLFSAAAAFIVTLAIVWTTTIGVGHYGDPGLAMADRVLAARAGILAVALCAFVLAALFAERRQHEAAVLESETRLQEALTGGGVTTFVWDVGTGSSKRSVNAAQVLGFDPGQDFTASDFLSRVHPDDRDRLKALLSGVHPERPAYTTTFRFNRPAGREVWLEETAKAEFDSVGALIRLKGLTLDVTARKRAADQQTLLIAALEHHVTNLLARVAAVAKDMGPHNHSLDEYIRALDHRIQSMADAHALLSKNHWAGADLAELVRRQLAPIASEASTTIDGPSVMLAVRASEALAMVLHELVTNAAKHGALCSPHGRVEVTWTHENAVNLSITWREIGGPAVAVSPDGKYGLRVIRDLVPNELGGSVDLIFAPGGVCCKIGIPLGAAAGRELTNGLYSGSFDVRSIDTRLRQSVSR
jgi:two-component sensor histidine kinase/integral membrane sensor domain MASE1